MFLFFLHISGIFASGKGECNNAEAETSVTIRGRIVIFGSEPHTFVGIVSEDGTEYSVYSPSHEAELRRLQGYKIEFTVVLLDEPKGYGSLFLKGGTVNPLSWKILDG